MEYCCKSSQIQHGRVWFCRDMHNMFFEKQVTLITYENIRLVLAAHHMSYHDIDFALAILGDVILELRDRDAIRNHNRHRLLLACMSLGK